MVSMIMVMMMLFFLDVVDMQWRMSMLFGWSDVLINLDSDFLNSELFFADGFDL